MWRTGLGLVIALGLGAADARAEARPTPQLTAPAEIIVDRWGVPHIFAANTWDAFLAQGYNAARDRLWQIDLWRKRGLGLLARDLGPAYLEQDRAARLFLYRGSMADEWAAYGPEAKSAAEAFVAGVNAYVAEVRAGSRPLPREFQMLGTQPDFWRPEDVVRIRSNALARNVRSEVARGRVACLADVETDRLRQDLSPSWRASVPEGLDPCEIPSDVLKTYDLATRGVSFERATRRIEQGLVDSAADVGGSNSWAISPGRTASGRPILASDPHRDLLVPSLRYLVHLQTPEWSLAGAGEPALPGVSIGHNGAIAFGLTVFSADQEDLYVYELHPQDPALYRYGGGWERMRVVRETIPVAGGADQEVEFAFTRHGPVLHVDGARRRAFALQSVWWRPGTSAYFAALGHLRSKSPEDFAHSLRRWGAPSLNMIYADVNGNIGRFTAGVAPVRRNWDGLLPAPGDGRYEWAGVLPFDALPPPELNPGRGWVASANEMNLPADYPVAERKLGFEWPNPARQHRIAEALSQSDKATIEDSMALQTDSLNSVAPRLIRLLAPLADASGEVAPAIRLLQSWDGRMAAESGAAALFEVWSLKHLGPAIAARAAPADVRPLIGRGSLATAVELVENPDRRLGPNPAAARDAALLESLRSAVAELGDRLGPDMSRWRWGDIHHAQPEHPLAAQPGGADFRLPRMPVGGSYLTPRASGWRSEDFRSSVGASLRMVIDVGAWDNSRVVNAPGQSGEPSSPHYSDHYRAWAEARYMPFLYTRAAIEAAATQRIRLVPLAR